jgi:folate-binding protein YgfZ
VPQSFIARLTDRGVVSVMGPDSGRLLQGLITNDIGLVVSQPAIHAGLLSPQGKILFEFLVVRAHDGFLLDVARDRAADLVKRLLLYKLRAHVEICDVSSEYAVLAEWGEKPAPGAAPWFADPRLEALGSRAIVPAVSVPPTIEAASALETDAEAYHAHRIGLGVPEGGMDYAFADAFPHEALFDQLNGVSFTKGCYVGQEIVSRMEHRGTARSRIVPVVAQSGLPQPGTKIMAGGVAIGALGSTAGARGLALLRLDRAAEARETGLALTAAETPIEIQMPAWARFTLAPASSA